MAVNNYDPVTGRPNFADSDPPDVKVDPGAAAKFAESVGNRIVGTTAELNAYAFRREGLEGYDTTLRREKVYFGTKASGRWVTVGGGCRARSSAPGTTNGNAGTPQSVSWDLEDFDTDGYHDTTANRSRFTALVPGAYHLFTKLHTVSTVNALGAIIGKNGAPDMSTRQYGTVSTFAGSGPATEGTYWLNQGDYLEVFSIGQASSLLMTADYCVAEFTRLG